MTRGRSGRPGRPLQGISCDLREQSKARASIQHVLSGESLRVNVGSGSGTVLMPFSTTLDPQGRS